MLNISVDNSFKEYFEKVNASEHAEGEKVNLDSLKIGDIVKGYKFVGYESDDVEITKDGTFIMPAKDIVIKPIFEKVTIKEEIKEIIKNPNTATCASVASILLITSALTLIVLKKRKLKKY